jgi:hypothetical protein
MKNFILCIVIANALHLNAQSTTKGISGESNWSINWTNFKPKSTNYNETTHILSGVIDKNTTLLKKNVYLLTGVVYVINNAVLTIEPGTTIRGDYDTRGALVIARGSRIIAEGEETNPIIFTSSKAASERKPGDWGGVIVMGDAPVNRFGGVGYLDLKLDPNYNVYGGENEFSYSGVLKFIRIEFAGRRNGTQEFNGLSLAGVGKTTKVEDIQVSFCNDDSFEFYGGDIEVKNLVSYKAFDDDFDFTEGAQINISNGLALRNPYASDSGKSRCFEVDSYDKNATVDLTKKLTKVVANNITLVNEENGDESLNKEAIFVKENANLIMRDVVVSGFKQFVLLENKIKMNPENLARMSFESVLLNNCKYFVQSEVVENNSKLEGWFSKSEQYSLQSANLKMNELFIESDFKRIPDFRLINANRLKTSALASSSN